MQLLRGEREMAKRSAEEQITKEGYEVLENKVESPYNLEAPQEVMAKRKILKPKGKIYDLSGNYDKSTLLNPRSNTSFTQKEERFKALANKFEAAIKQANTDQLVPDYRNLARKYLKFYEEIENLTPDLEPFLGKSAASLTRDTVLSPPEKKSEPSPDPEAGKVNGTKTQGPVFMLNKIPTMTSPNFSFNNKSSSSQHEKSGSQKDARGPTFFFDKKIEDPVFRLEPHLTDGQRPKVTETEANSPAFPSKPDPLVGQNAAIRTSLVTVNGSQPVDGEAQIVLASPEENHADVPGADNIPCKVATSLSSCDESNERVLFQVKAKLMLFKAEDSENPYQSLGVGELKVLQSLEDSSSRALMRAEGGLRVLLNARILKDVEYKRMGDGKFIRFPVFENESKLVTYMIKLGTAENGERLHSALNNAKIN